MMWTAVGVLLVIDLACILGLLHLAKTAPIRDDWGDD